MNEKEEKIRRCNRCGVILTFKNWYPSMAHHSAYICIDCMKKEKKEHRKIIMDMNDEDFKKLVSEQFFDKEI